MIKSKGALHHFTVKKIRKSKNKFNIPNKKNLISVIIGGPNQHYKFSKSVVYELIEKIRGLSS